MSNYDAQTADEIDVLTRTVWGEARGESEEGQAAVAHVILNRVKKSHMGSKTVKQ
ncbi:unnamed protein product, partial [Didymodactylos carnosus]